MLVNESMDRSSRIDAVVEFLASDGGPHLVKDVSMALNIPLNACDTIAQFLALYNFATFQDERVTIDRKTREFVLTTMDTPILQATPTP
jgi:hypothetical protein